MCNGDVIDDAGTVVSRTDPVGINRIFLTFAQSICAIFNVEGSFDPLEAVRGS